MFVLAHELYDALPIHQFKYLGINQWCEKVVALESQTLKDGTIEEKIVYTDSAANTETVVKILQPEKFFSEEARKDLKIGDQFEICP